ncbi:MAG: hypothetical protein I8H75_02080 [Myxococcaceae bacterium]|nr:hypothetical protein [Myxococcaceae bacterium]MBH2006124.1 hypothetical protein [Myxococcaceae bacterium]
MQAKQRLFGILFYLAVGNLMAEPMFDRIKKIRDSSNHEQTMMFLKDVRHAREAKASLREQILTHEELLRSNPVELDSQYCRLPATYPLATERYLIECKSSKAALCLDTAAHFANISDLWSHGSFELHDSIRCVKLKHESIDLLTRIVTIESLAGRLPPTFVPQNECHRALLKSNLSLVNCSLEDQTLCLAVQDNFGGRVLKRYKNIDLNQIKCSIIK